MVNTCRQRNRQSVMMIDGESLLTGGHILGDVAQEYGVDVAALTNGRRLAELVEARKECARRLYHEGLTVTDIGRVLCKDHSTIIHYLRGKALNPDGSGKFPPISLTKRPKE